MNHHIHAWSKVCFVHCHFSLWSLSLFHSGSTTGINSIPPWHVHKSFVSSICIQQLRRPKTCCSSFHLSNIRVIFSVQNLKTNSLLSWKKKSLITHKTKPDWFISPSGLVFPQPLVRVVTQCSSLEDKDYKGKTPLFECKQLFVGSSVVRRH